LVETLNLQDCVKIWDTQTSRRNIEDAIQTRLKALPDGELAELGLALGEARINRPITNAASAWSFLAMAGMPTEKLWKAVKLQNGVLVEVVQEQLGLTKKAAEQWIRSNLSTFITEQPTEPPLVKIT
jgi:hypothetical protein